MNSEWTMTVRPESPRTLLPITVDLSGPDAASFTIAVKSEDGTGFRVNETLDGSDHVRGTFWLERPGDYRVVAANPGHSLEKALHVREQVFLPFSVEFGIFSVALLIVGGGLILWYRSRKKAGSSSASSQR